MERGWLASYSSSRMTVVVTEVELEPRSPSLAWEPPEREEPRALESRPATSMLPPE